MRSPAPVWHEIELGQLGSVVTGRTPPAANPELFGADYPFITPSDMSFGDRSPTTERFISEAGRERFHRVLLPAGATCFVCIGATIGKVCLTSQPSFTNQQLNSIIPDTTRHDPRFVYSLLVSVADDIKALASGAATPIINKSSFAAFKVRVPPLPTQQRISAILSAYDDLIENNTRRIARLEEMARRLYEEWFVHFRFPGHNDSEFVDTGLGPTPAGWQIKTVSDTFEITGGGTPSKTVNEYWADGSIDWYSPTDLSKAGTTFMDGSSSKITPLGLRKSSARLFPAFSVMLTSRATIGAIAINTQEACTNQGFINCVPNPRFPLYLLMHWLRDNVDMFISLASGATFKEISKGVFKEIKLLVPPQGLAQDFERMVGPLMNMALALERKNTNLRAQRDLLLPKLVSGEINVCAAQPVLEAAE